MTDNERAIEDQEIFGAPSKVNRPIDFSAVHAMFNSAAASGLKKPHFYAENGLYLSLAPAHGKNPGAIYVSQNKEYMGKIVNGVFQPVALCSEAVKNTLREIAADPKNYAIKFGRETGNCCICNRLLTNEESVKFGIGPICAAKFGFMFEAEETTNEPATVQPVELSSGEPDFITIVAERATNVTIDGFEIDTAECVINYVRGADRKFVTFVRSPKFNTTHKRLVAFFTYEEALDQHKENLTDRAACMGKF